MSEENVEVVRQPIILRPSSRRRLEERLALRFPRAVTLLTRSVLRFPPRSRLRRAVLKRAVVTGWEAMNRVDLEAGLALYHPDVESIVDPDMTALGFDETVRGRERRLHNLRQVYAEFHEFRFDPDELIDLGDDRLLVVGRMKGTGRNSGAPFDSEWANLWTISAGRVIRDHVFRDRAEALEAAGLSE
jgi:ketosteroid isomerase-like protein